MAAVVLSPNREMESLCHSEDVNYVLDYYKLLDY